MNVKSARRAFGLAASAAGPTGMIMPTMASVATLERIMLGRRGPRSASRWRWAVHCCLCLLTTAGLIVALVPGDAVAGAQSAAPGPTPSSIALNYTIRFYPRFFTYAQMSLGQSNRLSGPDGMGPAYGAVPAPNNDTIYANFFLNLDQGPEIFTIPSTQVTYSLLTVDVFGSAFQTNIQKQAPGTYGLVPLGWHGTLPAGVTEVPVPYTATVWMIRADKYKSGLNMADQANAFRDSLRLASLPAYEKDPSSGATTVVPLRTYYPRAKAIADQAVESHTTAFFRMLQVALRSPATAPLSASDRWLSRAFDRVFAAANEAARHGNKGPLSVLIQAARTAHALIIDRYVSHADQNRWVYFDDIAAWGTDYLDRSATTEFLQFSNTAATSGYYTAFTDGTGVPLSGSGSRAYRLTFSKDQIPQAERFWSLTAYIPTGMTLVPNPATKYLVASYTPGLRRNRDGSITIDIQPTPPAPRLMPNWLPVPRGRFCLVLRVYGPEGNTSPGSKYVPPRILTR
jgi:hypothetical protein